MIDTAGKLSYYARKWNDGEESVGWAEKKRTVQVGDIVAYAPNFLRSIACYTGDMPRAKGKVTALVELGRGTTLAEIEWDHPDLPAKVHVANLCRVNSPEYGR
jgi:hypothetical protein